MAGGHEETQVGYHRTCPAPHCMQSYSPHSGTEQTGRYPGCSIHSLRLGYESIHHRVCKSREPRGGTLLAKDRLNRETSVSSVRFQWQSSIRHYPSETSLFSHVFGPPDEHWGQAVVDLPRHDADSAHHDQTTSARLKRQVLMHTHKLPSANWF